MKSAVGKFCGFVALVMVVLGSMTTAHAQERLLLAPLSASRAAALPAAVSARAEVLRQQRTSKSMQLLQADATALTALTVLIALPDAGSMRAVRKRFTTNVDGSTTWVGDMQAAGGTATLVLRNGDITGHIQYGLDSYSITPLGDGIHALIKIDHTKFPTDHPPSAPAITPDLLNRRSDQDPRPDKAPVIVKSADGTADLTQIDVLVPYTTNARVAYGGDMAAYAQLAVDDTNAAYVNSGINISLRLVGTMEISYNETGRTFDAVLADLLAGADPQMAAVQAKRSDKNADMVGLMINLTDYCGLASSIGATAQNAYMTAYWSCTVGNHSFAHELGHLYGARHDPYVDLSSTPYAYGHGYINPSKTWRTVMAYVNGCGNCPRLQYFSSPLKTYGGEAMGNAFGNDNVRVHNERAAAVAGFNGGNVSSVIFSPTPGTTLGLSTVDFTIATGRGATLNALYIGTTGAGSNNIYAQTFPTTSFLAVGNLPTEGQTLYVRLFSLIAGVWVYNDYTYTAATIFSKAVITSPSSGALLTSNTTTFNWSPGSSAKQYWLYVGTTAVGSSNLYSATAGTGLTATVSGLPTTGGNLYVRLFTLLSGAWQYNDYIYAAATPTKAVMTTPSTGATLAPSATFNWSVGSLTSAYALSAGTTGVGSSDLYFQSTTSTTATVTGIPATGGTIYVRLWSLIAGAWQSNDYTYTAPASPFAKAVMTNPTSGSAFASSFPFTWTAGTSVNTFYVTAGTTGPGSIDVFSQIVNGKTVTISGLPGSGTLYVRLFSLISGAWQYNDYNYSLYAQQLYQAKMTAPSPGSTLPNTSATFTWTTSSNVSLYYLSVGTTGAGSNDITFASSTGGSMTVSGLPAAGSLVNVRLWSLISGSWYYFDYVYRR